VIKKKERLVERLTAMKNWKDKDERKMELLARAHFYNTAQLGSINPHDSESKFLTEVIFHD
jgi:hypothetical protein